MSEILENGGPRRGGRRHGPHDHQQHKSGARLTQHLALLNKSSNLTSRKDIFAVHGLDLQRTETEPTGGMRTCNPISLQVVPSSSFACGRLSDRFFDGLTTKPIAVVVVGRCSPQPPEKGKQSLISENATRRHPRTFRQHPQLPVDLAGKSHHRYRLGSVGDRSRSVRRPAPRPAENSSTIDSRRPAADTTELLAASS